MVMYRFSRSDAKNVLATVKVLFEELPSVRMVKSYLSPEIRGIYGFFSSIPCEFKPLQSERVSSQMIQKPC
jgi:hypothetical protein